MIGQWWLGWPHKSHTRGPERLWNQSWGFRYFLGGWPGKSGKVEQQKHKKTPQKLGLYIYIVVVDMISEHWEEPSALMIFKSFVNSLDPLIFQISLKCRGGNLIWVWTPTKNPPFFSLESSHLRSHGYLQIPRIVKDDKVGPRTSYE